MKINSVFPFTNWKNKCFFSVISKKLNPNLRSRIKQPNEFIDPNNVIKKFRQNIPIPTNFTKPKTINSMDFDQFTEQISKSQINIEQKDEELTENNIKLMIPWQSELYLENPKEINILSPLDLYHIIKEEDATKILQSFLKGLSDFDFKGLSSILENTFLSDLQKKLMMIRNKKFKFSFENLENNKFDIDLFNLRNIFAVGVSMNRKKNKFSSHYIINESKFNNAPITQLILKRLNGKERGTIIMQFHLAITSNICMKVFNDKNQIIHQDNKEKPSIHVMVLESEILDCEYKTLKNMLRYSNLKNKDVLTTQVSDLKTQEKSHNLKIIDFDNFMKGNGLISEFS